MNKPKCKLIGTDGNVFSIIGKVSSALKRAGLNQEAALFTKSAFSASSYDEVLALAIEYVDIC